MKSKFDLLVEKYMVVEASGHKSKALTNLLDEIARHPSIRAVEMGKNIKIYPHDKDFPLYTAHYGEEAYHPVRRYFARIEAAWEANKGKAQPAAAPQKSTGYWTAKKHR